MTGETVRAERSLYDPTSEQAPAERARLAPPDTLQAKTIALLDIGKTRSDEFLDYLDALLVARGLTTLRVAKPTNTKVADAALLQRIATEADVVVEALAD
jgi:hypothetical protein